MTDWIRDNLWATWLITSAVLATTELLGADLVLLMFALGAVAAGVSALFLPSWVTLLVFAAASVALLGVIRPRFVARLHAGPTLSVGHHDLVGRTAVVDETVTDNGGRVIIDGVHWTARAQAGQRHEAGAEVLITAIDGATATVAAKES